MIPHLLSLILFLPALGMIVLLLLPASSRKLDRAWANIISLVTLGVSLLLIPAYNLNAAGYQFVERAQWIPSIGAQYLIGIDGISLLMVLLTTLISFIAALCSWRSVTERTRLYYAMLLLLETGVLGVFVSMDLFLFYVFWDLVLIPMYFLIAIFGGEKRSYAAMKFFLYTLLGSVFMLLGFLALYFEYGSTYGVYTFELQRLLMLNLPLGVEQWIFFALFFGFAVKIPMFPLHTWLPDAHTEAPTAGSVLLAALLLKMGTYGFHEIFTTIAAKSVQYAVDCEFDGYAFVDCHHLWRSGLPHPTRLETPGCLLVHQPFGLLHVGNFLTECQWTCRKCHSTDQSRHHHGSAISACRFYVRPPSYARNF